MKINLGVIIQLETHMVHPSGIIMRFGDKKEELNRQVWVADVNLRAMRM